MYITIWIANQTIPWLTQMGIATNSIAAGAEIAALDQGGSPITYIFTQLFTRENIMGLAVIGVIYALSLVAAVVKMKQRAKEIEAAEM